jgi:hypothetical protein
MSTVNTSIDSDWALVVSEGDDFLLTAPHSSMFQIEVAIADSLEDLEGINGHLLFGNQRESINRPLIGPGDVYARTVGVPAATASVAITAWTPA